MALVSMLIHEIVSIDVSPVEVVWQLRIWDLLSLWVLLDELLGLLDGCFEVDAFSKLNITDRLLATVRCLGEHDWLVAMSPVVAMMLLVFADIGLPAKVHFIDSLDKKIGLVSRDMLQMSVMPSVGLSPAEEHIRLIRRR